MQIYKIHSQYTKYTEFSSTREQENPRKSKICARDRATLLSCDPVFPADASSLDVSAISLTFPYMCVSFHSFYLPSPQAPGLFGA